MKMGSRDPFGGTVRVVHFAAAGKPLFPSHVCAGPSSPSHHPQGMPMRFARLTLAGLMCALLLACRDTTITNPAPARSTAKATHSIAATTTTSTGIPFAALVPFGEVYAVNTDGHIVGGYLVNGEHHGYLFRDNAITDLGTLGGNDSQALGINDLDQVVGRSLNASGQPHAYLWDNGVMTDLAAGSSGSSEARGINGAGTVVGITGRFPFIWQNGAMSVLPTIQGNGGVADAINAAGDVAGSSWNADFSAMDPVMWTGGQLIDLGGGASYAEALALNNLGQVVGYRQFSNGEIHAVLWDHGTVTDLGGFGGTWSMATGINDAGMITGWASVGSTGLNHAWSWSAGVLTDLGVESNTFNSLAYGINRAGQIAGNAGHDGGLWLAPVKPADNTPPNIVATVSGTKSAEPFGSQGWYTSAVSVHWSVTDPESAISGTSGCGDASVTTNTTSVTFTCSASSEGGTATQSVTIRVDLTPPVVSPTVTGTRGNAGWYTSDATISWTTTDDISPVIASCTPTTLTTDTDPAGQTYSCTAISAGGSTTASVNVKRDVTRPIITFAGMTSYTVDQMVSITCSAIDPSPGSGLASLDCPGAHGDAYNFILGSSALTGNAADVAGNMTTASSSFEVRATIQSVCALVQRWVVKVGVAQSLCAKLGQAPRQAFVNEINAQTGKAVANDKAAILIRLAGGL